MNKFPKLFIPGPTHVSNNILEVLSTPQIGHRTPEISVLISNIKQGLKKVLYTNNHIYLVSHAATGLWEMGIINCTKKGILHAVNGAFSSKWSTIPSKCGLKSESIDYDWGFGIKTDDVDKMLSTGNFDVFAMVHNETSTGVKSNLEEISDLLRNKYPDIIWLVDAVSSMAGIKIEVDRLGIDFIFSSTQKAWGIPAGFSIVSVSDRCIEKSKTIKDKGYFLDILTYEKYHKKDQTPSTPSIPHMFALKKVLEIIENEGLDNRWERHKEMASIAQDWALSHKQSLFPEPGCRSETITCINNIQNWDINKINDKLLNFGYRMDRGYGNLRGHAFRIAHMGNIYQTDLKEYLSDFDKVLLDV